MLVDESIIITEYVMHDHLFPLILLIKIRPTNVNKVAYISTATYQHRNCGGPPIGWSFCSEDRKEIKRYGEVVSR